jgi:uncharacterized membrane protein YhaH (DUF805 family)
VDFVTAVKTCLKKYATFQGVASRSEYWWFALFYFVVLVVVKLTGVAALYALVSLALILPSVAVAVRRHHDAGRSGWWWFTNLIPPWGIYLLCTKSKIADNKFAPARSGGSSLVDESHVVASSSGSCPTCGKLFLPGQTSCASCGFQM